MLAGTTLNIFNNHADRVKMANIAQAINVLQAVILTDEEKLLLTPTYHVFRMYTPHHDAQLLPVSFVSPLYIHDNEALPAVSISASRNAEGTANFSLVNIDTKRSHEVELDVADLGLTRLEGEILTGASVNDHNTFDAPNTVMPKPFKGATVRDGKLRLTVPPFSVVVLKADK